MKILGVSRIFECSLYLIRTLLKSLRHERIHSAHTPHADRGLLHADTDKEALGELTAPIGDKFWSAPEKRLVRPRSTGKKKARATAISRRAKSDEKIGLRHSSEKEAGTLAVLQSLPRGAW